MMNLNDFLANCLPSFANLAARERQAAEDARASARRMAGSMTPAGGAEGAPNAGDWGRIFLANGEAEAKAAEARAAEWDAMAAEARKGNILLPVDWAIRGGWFKANMGTIREAMAADRVKYAPNSGPAT